LVRVTGEDDEGEKALILKEFEKTNRFAEPGRR
jgi:hypothetical protein